MKKVFYEKIGRRYQPVSEYDSEFLDSLPKGSHLIISQPGGRSCKYNIDPDYAALIAAGKVANEAMCQAIAKATELQPPHEKLTPLEKEAWDNLIKVFGDQARRLQYASISEVADAAVDSLISESNKLLKNPAVKQAYDEFMLIAKLTKERTNE